MLNASIKKAISEYVKEEVQDGYDYNINVNDLDGLTEGILFQLDETITVAIQDAMNVLNSSK